MESLQHAATPALRALLSRQPNTPAKVAFAWQLAAGPALARACAVTWTPDGMLRIRARDAAWRQEVRRGRAIVAERLAQVLGPEVVRKIEIE